MTAPIPARTNEGPKPDRLWSLWDMINFRFSAVHSLLSELTISIKVSHHNMRIANEAVDDPTDTQGTDAIKQAIELISYATEECRTYLSDLKCPHIDSALERLGRWPDLKRREWSELNTRSRALRDAIETELRKYYYYQYPAVKAQKLLAWKTDWTPTLATFPSLEWDVYSATDCCCLGHNTASVFHCMRILETGLRALASDVGLTFDLQQWANIIEQIESAIAAERRTLPKGAPRNERLQFLSEAAKEFFHFKDGWRNHVSHGRGIYDEHQALSVLEHVRTFMNHLASRLSEASP